MEENLSVIRLCWNPLESAFVFVQLCLLCYLTDSLLLQITWLSWAKSLLIGYVMPASHREAELPQEDSSQGQDHARWAVHHKALIIQIINSCIILKHCFIFLHVHSLPAGAHSRAGWDGVRRFLHCAVCRPGLHRRPVDERLFLLHASPLASHLSLYFEQQ